MNIDRDEFNVTPSSKEAQRRQLAEDVELFLANGGIIEILPPGKATNLDLDE